MLQLTQEDLIADYHAHIDAVLLSVSKGDIRRAQAERSELVRFLENNPDIGYKAWQARK
jgi:hypothetical protein